MEDAEISLFVDWFQTNGGFIDTQLVGITKFPDSGRGAIALCDIPEGRTIFTLPRTLTLSTRTSLLPSLFGLDAWRAHGLHKGWAGLMLCMMWEDAWAHDCVVDEGGQVRQDVQTKWGPYIRTLPTTFDTPMFWNEEELHELKGTSVIEKIGRDDADHTFWGQLVPVINTSPTLFPPRHHEVWYSLDAYHRAGSRILSRSFTVSRWIDDKVGKDEYHGSEETQMQWRNADEAHDPDSRVSNELSMHADDAHSKSSLEDTDEKLDSDSEDDEDEDPSDVAMVPMADLLNARWGSENAKLYYEPLTLRMISTRPIKQGEQIFNTYGDPPNSDLLRRYGHVDLIQLPGSSSVSTLDIYGDIEMDDGVETIKYLGNPSDIAEIRADLVVSVIQTTNIGPKENDSCARIDWWLDEGEDDTFVLTLPESGSRTSTFLPSELISLIRLLLLPGSDFRNIRSKGKLPKGKLNKTDKDGREVLETLDEILKQREGMYVGGSAQDDEQLLSAGGIPTRHKRHAVIVRLGEKRILKEVRRVVKLMLTEISFSIGAECGNERFDTRRKDKKDVVGRERMGGCKKHGINGTEGDRKCKKVRK